MRAFTERRFNRVLAWVWVTGFMVFLLAPLFVIVVAAFSEPVLGRAVFPPRALTLR